MIDTFPFWLHLRRRYLYWIATFFRFFVEDRTHRVELWTMSRYTRTADAVLGGERHKAFQAQLQAKMRKMEWEDPELRTRVPSTAEN